jgi:hypothetical protein
MLYYVNPMLSFFAVELPVPVWLAHRAIKTPPLWEYSLMVFWLNNFPETRLALVTALLPLICYFATLIFPLYFANLLFRYAPLTALLPLSCFFVMLLLPIYFRYLLFCYAPLTAPTPANLLFHYAPLTALLLLICYFASKLGVLRVAQQANG